MTIVGRLLRKTRHIVQRPGNTRRATKLLADGSGKTPHELFNSVDDEFWLWLMTEGCRVHAGVKAVLPSMPEERVQLQSNGIAGDHALRDAWAFYQLIKELYEKHVGKLTDSKGIVDFGVGWARMIRFFLKDVDPQKLWGIDHYDKVIAVSKETCKWGNFELIAPFPPTAFADASVDLIYCYSVFSHLSEDAHLRWLGEFSRILRPGGLLVATTWSEDFLLRCRDARTNTRPEFWKTHLPRLFVDTDMWLSHYNAGGFCYETDAAQYGDVAHYLGETCIPKAYVQQHWTRFLDFVDFIDDHAVTSQNVIVMKKSESAGVSRLQVIVEANRHAAAGDSEQALSTLRRLPVEDFCDLLLEVPATAPALKTVLPSMASEEVQRHWTGACGRELMNLSLDFMRSVDSASREYRGLGLAGKILDYGCGWGRLLRLLLWYVEPDCIYGTDPWDQSLAMCRQHNCPGHLAPCDYVPTTLPFAEAFDVIYAFSVFTHLSEKTADAVLHVLRKVIRSDGMLVITIRPRGYWESHHSWRDGYTQASLLESHDKDGFAFMPHQLKPIEGDVTYGDTSMTLDFIRRRWPQWKIAGTKQNSSDPQQVLVFLLPA